MKTIPKHTLDYLDSWLTLRSKWEDLPGFSVAIAKDGEVIFNHAYGSANLETDEALRTDHLFRVASHSKSFTATAVLQLQEQGKLRIDDYVVTHLGWLTDHKDARWKTVTIRQLLSHSAGVIRDGLDSNFWSLRKPFPNREEFRAAVLEADLVLEPNTKLKYSNYGYGLLGEIIEQVSGVSYAAYVCEYIIDALKLECTFPEFSDELVSKLATGYSRLNLAKKRLAFPHVSTNALAAATGFCSTAGDLARFFSALRTGTGLLLSDESKREMQREQWKTTDSNTSYGLGLEIEQIDGRCLLGHGGGFPGFVTKSYIDMSDGLAVIVLSNAHGAWSQTMAKAMYGLIDIFGETPKENLLKYEGRFATLYGTTDIIATAQGMRMISSNSWYPLYNADELEVIDEVTLKLTKTSSFSSEGELLHYEFNQDGSVKQVVESGSLLVPSEDGDLQQTWT